MMFIKKLYDICMNFIVDTKNILVIFFHTMNVYLEPVVNALKIIGGKWQIAILYRLNQSPCRFGELKKTLYLNNATNAN